jgi:hypothetical protein
VQSGAAWSLGAIGFGEQENDFDSFSAYASVQVAITANLAAQAQYYYYRYTFASSDFLLEGVPLDHDRHGVQAGLVVWVPLLR